MQQEPEGMIPVEEFARQQRIWADQAIKMIEDGFYSGRLVGEKWFVDRAELSKAPKHLPEIPETQILNRAFIGSLGSVLLLLEMFLILFVVVAFEVNKAAGLGIAMLAWIASIVFCRSGLNGIFMLLERESTLSASRKALASYILMGSALLIHLCLVVVVLVNSG